MEISEAQPGFAATSRPSGSTPVTQKDESNEVHGQYEPGSLKAQSLILMQCVTQHLGEHSRVWTTIRHALNEFREGRLSKREAYSTMTAVLGDNQDLMKGLDEVLNHKEANWGPGDFEQQEAEYETPVSESHEPPAFLQPEHQLRWPLTPMSADWYPQQFGILPSINPEVLRSPMVQHIPGRSALVQLPGPRDMSNDAHNGHDGQSGQTGYGDHESYAGGGQHYQPCTRSTPVNWNPFSANGTSSPAHPLPSQMPLAHRYVSPSIPPTESFNTYAEAGFGAVLSSPGYGAVEHGPRTSYPSHEGWQEGHTQGDWTNAELQHSHDGIHTFTHIAPYQQLTPKFTSSHLESPRELPSDWGTPVAPPTGRPTPDEMQPPSKKRTRNSSVAYTSGSHQGHEGTTELQRQSYPSTSVQSLTEYQSKTKHAGAERRRTRAEMGPGQFIHAICGKGFHNRSAVKKHHWGTKNDDITTTTGCWAKHDKPNIQWDAHPSCKQPKTHLHNAQPKKSPQFLERAETLRDLKAPIVPTMIPNSANIIPGFPTLQELPDTVAETVNAAPVFDGEPIPYNTSRMPISGDLDTLATAVNVLSEIDAPKPQGRNDSVVSYLDAQATAAEHHSQSLRYQSGSQEGKYAFYAQKQQPLFGLGISYADGLPVLPPWSGKAASSKTRDAPTALGMDLLAAAAGHASLKTGKPISPNNGQDEEGTEGRRTSNPTSTISKQERKATGISESSGPDKKKQKV
ncbi:hypothetical protein K458DRAFT_100835 [Lentithecium fluviatile CBS 122367]|uniref:Uncharacterized protein n=1 Tax=Lentithecium fluviatile CBS 122367 TaxID=1168545 RepID=A0A6G1JI67_9PLEO|nr:hypothetical protein K458DRAFT_100835 [Lentithecium fluviatile CBS 122367]